MTINTYRVTPGKPMIWSLESARLFIESTVNPLSIRCPRGHFVICDGHISLNRQLDEWVSIEVWRKDGDDAVRCVYQIRKFINAHFKN